MDASSQSISSLSFEIAILQAKNLEFKSHGNLFVRCYLSSGDNKRINLNSREVSAKSDLVWNESFSLECSGSQDSINSLKRESVVFELRWRNPNPNFLGTKGSSKLLGRAEIPWKTVMESSSPEMGMEKWVVMVPNKRCVPDDVKPPTVRIAMKIGIQQEMMEVEKKKKERRNGGLKKWRDDECGCCKNSGCSCQDYEVFALAAAFEAL